MADIEYLAEQIVQKIVKNLSDHALKHEWGAIDPEIQEEIRQTWKRIIVEYVEEEFRQYQIEQSERYE